MSLLHIKTTTGDVIELYALRKGMGLAILPEEESTKADGKEYVQITLTTSELKKMLRKFRFKEYYISSERFVKIWIGDGDAIHFQSNLTGVNSNPSAWKMDNEASQAFINYVNYCVDRVLPSDLLPFMQVSDEQVLMQIAEGIGFRKVLHSSKYWDSLGIRIGMSGETDLANLCFLKALEIDPGFHRSRLNIIVNLERADSTEEALRLIEEVPENYPRRNVILANLLSSAGREQEATKFYEIAAVEEPEFYVPYIRLLQILEPSRGPAFDYWLEQSIHHVRNSPSIAVFYCRYLLDQGNIIELACLDWIDHLSPINELHSVVDRKTEIVEIAEAQLARLVAQVYINKDLQDLKRAIKLLHKFPENWNVCAYAKMLVSAAAQIGQPDLVLQAYERVCDECVENEIGVSKHCETIIAFAESVRENPQQAIALCEKVLAEHPDHLLTLDQYWSILDDVDRLDEAIAVAERIWQIDPNWTYISYNLGFLCAKIGQFGKAQYYYSKQIEQDPQHYMAIENLVFVELLQNQIENAKKRFDDFCQTMQVVEGASSKEWALLEKHMNEPGFEELRNNSQATVLMQHLQLKKDKFHKLVETAISIQESPTYSLRLQEVNHADEPIIGSYTGIERNQFSMENILTSLEKGSEAQLSEVRFQLEQQLKGDYSTTLFDLVSQLPNYDVLPLEAQSALAEGEKRLRGAANGDFSLAVVAFSKAVEVSLREMIFTKFRVKYQVEIEVEREVNIKIIGKQRGADRFLNFVEKGYFLGLGEMALVLNLCNQPSNLHAPCIFKLRRLIIETLGFHRLLVQETVTSISDLAKNFRNRAVHSVMMDRDMAFAVRKTAIEILGTFRGEEDGNGVD